MAALGVPQVDEGITSEALAGPILAYSKASAARAPGYAFAYIVVRNLRTGRVLRKIPTGSSNPPDPIGTDPATAIVVKGDGAVAWLTQVIEDVPLPVPCPGPYACPALLRVESVTHSTIHALDKSGNRLIASSTDIDPHSLTLKHGMLHWAQSSMPMSSPLD